MVRDCIARLKLEPDLENRPLTTHIKQLQEEKRVARRHYVQQQRLGENEYWETVIDKAKQSGRREGSRKDVPAAAQTGNPGPEKGSRVRR